MPNLVGREQCGFIGDHNSLDNILTVQEMVHSIKKDFNVHLRIIVKIDIEKVYDMLSQNVILTTVYKMGFLAIWISWI